MMNALLLPLLASLLPMALVLAVLLLARHRERRQGLMFPAIGQTVEWTGAAVAARVGKVG